SLRSLIGIVSQDTVLFHDTVRNNLAYGMPNRYSDAEVEAAARAANAHAFITALPDGYATMLGERGTRLSGGQRQRIAIARALLLDPPILILDEATSALDTESERLVQAAIDRLLEGRTVFVIAHRLSTVRHATQILVLDKGRIIESGTHDELRAQQGAYSRLYDMQFRSATRVDVVPDATPVSSCGSGVVRHCASVRGCRARTRAPRARGRLCSRARQHRGARDIGDGNISGAVAAGGGANGSPRDMDRSRAQARASRATAWIQRRTGGQRSRASDRGDRLSRRFPRARDSPDPGRRAPARHSRHGTNRGANRADVLSVRDGAGFERGAAPARSGGQGDRANGCRRGASAKCNRPARRRSERRVRARCIVAQPRCSCD